MLIQDSETRKNLLIFERLSTFLFSELRMEKASF